MNYYQKYLKYKNKYLEIKKQIGGAKLIELARTNSDFRSWCKTIKDEKITQEIKMKEFSKFEHLLDENEKQKVIDYISKGGVNPDWLTIALGPIDVSPGGEQLVKTKQAENIMKEAFVYILRVKPSKAKEILTKLIEGPDERVRHWVSYALQGKQAELNEVIRLIDNHGIEEATEIIHRLVPDYTRYLEDMKPTSEKATMASSSKVSFSKLVEQNLEFNSLLLKYLQAENFDPSYKIEIRQKLEEFKKFLTPEGVTELDDFFMPE
jgi:hypothetical protein